MIFAQFGLWRLLASERCQWQPRARHRRRGQWQLDLMGFAVTVRRFHASMRCGRTARHVSAAAGLGGRRHLHVWWTRRPPCVRTGTVAFAFGRQRLLPIRRARTLTRTRMQTGLIEVFMHTQAHARKHRAQGTETSFRCQALAIIQCTLAGQLQSMRCTHRYHAHAHAHTPARPPAQAHTHTHTHRLTHRVPC